MLPLTPLTLKIDKSPNFLSENLPLTPLTSKKLFISQFFFLYFAVDAVDNWKNMNESKKNFKSTDGLTSDAAVDTVDIKNW